MEDNVRATYICWKCDEEYVEFNFREGEAKKCPQCKTLNYPGFEVSIDIFKTIQLDIFAMLDIS